MGAGHNHGAPTTEAGAPGDHRARLWIAFGLTATIVIAQAIGSIVTGSLAWIGTDTGSYRGPDGSNLGKNGLVLSISKTF